MAGMPASSVGALVLLEDKLLTAAAASFDFTGIPATYRHLLLIVNGRGSVAAGSTLLQLTLNGDGAANYDGQRLVGIDITPSASAQAAATFVNVGDLAGATLPAGISGHTTLTLYDYAGTTFQKTLTGSAGVRFGVAAADMVLTNFMGAWRSTAAVTRVTIAPAAGNFIAGSRATLYALT